MRIVYYWFVPWNHAYASSTVKGFAELGQRNAEAWKKR